MARGTDPRSAVTNRVFAKFRAPLNIDFGSGGTADHGSSAATNAPAFASETLDPSMDYWFNAALYDVNGTGKQPDVAGAAVSADGTEVGLLMDFGTSSRSSWEPDWSESPSLNNISSGVYNKQGGIYGVFCTALGKDWIHAGSGKKLYVRISGLSSGRYTVFVAARSHFANHLQQAVRIATGDASTVLAGDWTAEEKLAEYYDPNEYPDDAAANDNEKNARNVSATWTEGVSYLSKTVVVGPDAPDILLVSDCVLWNDDKGGAINMVQIVPVNAPATLLLIL